jgi:hypothetical protein
MKKPINEIKRMQQLAGIDINFKKLLKEDITDDINNDLAYAEFEDEQGRIEYLQGIIEYCQELIKEIQSEMDEDEDEMNENQEFNANQAYEKSPNEQTYKDMLDVVKEYEDEKYLKSFISTFPQGKSINKKEWEKWSRSMEDYDPEGYTYLNWISVSDPDVYKKAGVL